MSKAITAGLEYAKWTTFTFDVSQDLVLGVLVGTSGNLMKCNPTKLDGKKINLLDKKNSKWSEFVLAITEMTKDEFLRTCTDQTKEYLVGKDNHMLYVEKVEKGGQMLLCMNSGGENSMLNRPRPRVFTQSVEDNHIFAIELLDSKSPPRHGHVAVPLMEDNTADMPPRQSFAGLELCWTGLEV